MNEEKLQIIQQQISYTFKNPHLLEQAFTRRSYSAEHGGEDNEILEFIGDKVLDFLVVKWLTQKHSNATAVFEKFDLESQHSFAYAFGAKKPCKENTFICDCSEAQLTEIKKLLVQKNTLAERIDALRIADYLRMGNGDIQQNTAVVNSVKEDLFEAILGAIAIDCNWDMKKLQTAFEVLLDPESILKERTEEDYVQLIEQWDLVRTGTYPLYHFEPGDYFCYTPFDGISQHSNYEDSLITQAKFQGYLKISDALPSFRGFGRTISETKRNVARTAYEYLLKEGLFLSIQDELDNPNKDEAISQLEILARRGYFSIPTYQFSESHDGNGNPVWTCKCRIPEHNKTYSAKSSSKKESKKTAAHKMLKFVLKD